MTKRPISGRCVYCLDNFDKGTWDHVFPDAWYPVTTPQNLQKWEVPCCIKCNHEFGKLEQKLLLRFGLCVDPKKAESSGITDTVRRSLDPKYGKNEKDKQKRKKTKEKIKREIYGLNIIPSNGFLPNFGSYVNDTPPYLAIDIQPNELEAFSCKLVRGLTYVFDKSFIEKADKIEVIFTKDNNEVEEVNQKISRHGQIDCVGTGIKVGHVFSKDKQLALYAIDIWDKLKIHAFVEMVQAKES
jgi:hypothetical protein